MAMKSMAMSAEEIKERKARYEIDDEGEGERYPYGLCLSLDDDALAKLGMTQPPKVGSTMTITAKVKVTSARISEDEGGEPESSSSWQITAMEVGQDTSKPEPSSVLYS